MKRILYVATTARLHINVFHTPYIKALKENGWTVDVVTNGDAEVPYVDNDFKISIKRNPLKLTNIGALINLVKIMKKNRYEVVSCHTPVGGTLGRIAAKWTRTENVVYLAHGFHFFKGGIPIVNSLYRTIERLLARMTDVLITINDEDYQAAKAFKLKPGGRVYKVNGIGVDLNRFDNHIFNKYVIRKQLGIPENAFLLTNVGELSKNKNQRDVIETLASCQHQDIWLLLCGTGPMQRKLEKYAKKLSIADKVVFAGYRKDIPRLLHASDAYITLSKREGLPISVIESMASGLPIICSDIRGNKDLIDDGLGGYVVKNKRSCANIILELQKDPNKRFQMGLYNKRKSCQYSLDKSLYEILKIYDDIIKW